jgi:hypothetical protein
MHYMKKMAFGLECSPALAYTLPMCLSEPVLFSLSAGKSDFPKLHVSWMTIYASSVTTVDDQGGGSNSRTSNKSFFSVKRPDPLWGPPSLLFSGYGGWVLSVGHCLTRPWPEADHSPLSSNKLRMSGVVPQLPLLIYTSP